MYVRQAPASAVYLATACPLISVTSSHQVVAVNRAFQGQLVNSSNNQNAAKLVDEVRDQVDKTVSHQALCECKSTASNNCISTLRSENKNSSSPDLFSQDMYDGENVLSVHSLKIIEDQPISSSVLGNSTDQSSIEYGESPYACNLVSDVESHGDKKCNFKKFVGVSSPEWEMVNYLDRYQAEQVDNDEKILNRSQMIGDSKSSSLHASEEDTRRRSMIEEAVDGLLAIFRREENSLINPMGETKCQSSCDKGRKRRRGVNELKGVHFMELQGGLDARRRFHRQNEVDVSADCRDLSSNDASLAVKIASIDCRDQPANDTSISDKMTSVNDQQVLSADDSVGHASSFSFAPDIFSRVFDSKLLSSLVPDNNRNTNDNKCSRLQDDNKCVHMLDDLSASKSVILAATPTSNDSKLIITTLISNDSKLIPAKVETDELADVACKDSSMTLTSRPSGSKLISNFDFGSKLKKLSKRSSETKFDMSDLHVSESSFTELPFVAKPSELGIVEKSSITTTSSSAKSHITGYHGNVDSSSSLSKKVTDTCDGSFVEQGKTLNNKNENDEFIKIQHSGKPGVVSALKVESIGILNKFSKAVSDSLTSLKKESRHHQQKNRKQYSQQSQADNQHLSEQLSVRSKCNESNYMRASLAVPGQNHKGMLALLRVCSYACFHHFSVPAWLTCA